MKVFSYLPTGEGELIQIILSDVLYCPKFTVNLLSIPQFNDEGFAGCHASNVYYLYPLENRAHPIIEANKLPGENFFLASLSHIQKAADVSTNPDQTRVNGSNITVRQHKVKSIGLNVPTTFCIFTACEFQLKCDNVVRNHFYVEPTLDRHQ